MNRSLSFLRLEWTSRAPNEASALCSDNGHRVSVLHDVAAAQLGDTMFKQRQHKARPSGNQRRQRREKEINRQIWGGYVAFQRVRIETLDYAMELFFLPLASHIVQDTRPCCVSW